MQPASSRLMGVSAGRLPIGVGRFMVKGMGEELAMGRAGTDHRAGLLLPMGGARLLPPDRWYPLVAEWLPAMEVAPHVTARRSLAEVVVARLTAQSRAPAELARPRPSPRAVPARATSA